MNLGIDIGRVIIAPGEGGGKEDTSFIEGSLEEALQTPPMDGAFDAVKRLTEAFERRVWLISKCFPRVQDRTRRWLDHHRFYDVTGVRRDRLIFCLERPQKATHCRRLEITHFVDDRLDVLEAMRGIVPNLYLFGEQRRPVPDLEWLMKVASWPEALEAILSRRTATS